MAYQVFIQKQDGETVSWEEESSKLLSELLEQAGLPMDLPCGGKRRCGKCRVKAEGELSPLQSQERAFLTDREIDEGTRLACMTYALGDVRIFMGEKRDSKVLTQAAERVYQKCPLGSGLGLAVDIGTTTVAAYLYHLEEGRLLASTGMKNPQSVYGADVISRIEKSMAGEREAMGDCIAAGIQKAAEDLCRQAGVSPEEITSGVITGNTAMLSLLTKTDVTPLSAAPFQPERYFGETVSGEQLGICKTGEFYLPRIISAYVGADITTAIEASGMLEQQANSVLIDIGTNGEMALKCGERLVCCSTAAGPAFEGAGIYMGMPAMAGAISQVEWQDGVFHISTIDQAEPIGICGSGIIDATAALLKSGIVDETGLILEEDHPYTEWITEVSGQPAIRLGGTSVCITQKDIRAIQLAKAAICAGIHTMLHACSLELDQVDCLYIAGGFGSLLNQKHAAEIGLIPAELVEKSKTLGNAAGMGATMILQSREILRESEETARRAETIELSTDPYFMDKYVECMLFS